MAKKPTKKPTEPEAIIEEPITEEPIIDEMEELPDTDGIEDPEAIFTHIEGKTATSSEWESFVMREINRSELRNAPYNPRQITESAKFRLKTAMSKVGLVCPIVYNERTKHIVGGHQRIAQLDELEMRTNYNLTVAVINVSVAREKQINILLNNPEAQGDWDLEALKNLLAEDDIDFSVTGFDPSDIYKLFGHDADESISAGVVELADAVEAARGRFAEMTDIDLNRKHSNEFYCVFVFRTNQERFEFTSRWGLEDNRYQSGAQLDVMLRDPDLVPIVNDPPPIDLEGGAGEDNTSTEIPESPAPPSGEANAQSVADGN